MEGSKLQLSLGGLHTIQMPSCPKLIPPTAKEHIGQQRPEASMCKAFVHELLYGS